VDAPREERRVRLRPLAALLERLDDELLQLGGARLVAPVLAAGELVLAGLEHLLVGEVLEQRADVRDGAERRQRHHRRRGEHVPAQLHRGARRRRQRHVERALHLREVAAARGPHQQLERLVAVLWIDPGQPRLLAVAGAERALDGRVDQRAAALAAPAHHVQLGEVAGGALQEHQIVRLAAGLVPHERVPRHVLDVPAHARAHEAHRHEGAPRAVVARVHVAAGARLAARAAALQRAAGGVLAHEPARELQHLDAGGARGGERRNP
jgi:hypothetical protein